MPKVVDHAVRRAELVDAAWRVIAEEGLEAATMRRIAEAAGCTTGRVTPSLQGNHSPRICIDTRYVFAWNVAHVEAVVLGMCGTGPREHLIDAIRAGARTTVLVR